MKHSITAPETNELETLIAGAFDAVPGPDHIRMQSIRDALNLATKGTRSQKSLNKLPWWFVLLLTGGLAMAGVWIVERVQHSAEKSGEAIIQKERPDQGEIQHEQNRHLPPREQGEQPVVDSPVIYQRE